MPACTKRPFKSPIEAALVLIAIPRRIPSEQR